MLPAFLRDENGNFAIVSALMMIPLVLSVGAGIDLTRLHSASSHL